MHAIIKTFEVHYTRTSISEVGVVRKAIVSLLDRKNEDGESPAQVLWNAEVGAASANDNGVLLGSPEWSNGPIDNVSYSYFVRAQLVYYKGVPGNDALQEGVYGIGIAGVRIEYEMKVFSP